MSTTIAQTNFTGGEFSPRLRGRVDIQKWNNSVKSLENLLPLIHGGVRSAPGSQFLAAAKHGDKQAILYRFEFSKNDALMLEVGELYIWIHDSAGAGIMDPTSYSIAGITLGATTTITCGAAHGYSNGQRVHISGITTGPTELNGLAFDISNVSGADFDIDYDTTGLTAWSAGGTVEAPYEITTTYTEAQLSEIKFTASADTIIMLHPDVAPQRLRRFENDNWQIDNFPFDPAPYDETGHRFGSTATLSAKTVGAGRTLTSFSAAFQNADVGRFVRSGIGYAEITAFTSTTQVTVTITSEFDSTVLATNSWTIEKTPISQVTPSASTPRFGACDLTAGANTWRSEDVGSVVSINGGRVQIDTIASALVANGTILSVLDSTTAAIAGSWVLNQQIFNDALGYPRTGAFYQQRLILAGTDEYPNSFWASRIREYQDFTIGDFSDDGIFFTLDSEQYNPIVDMGLRSNQLVLFTTGGETLVSSTDGFVFSPTTIEANSASILGSADVQSMRVGKDLVFVQRGSRKLRAVEYRFTQDDFDSVDLTKLAEHITENGIVDMANQQEPDQIVWCVRGDGDLLSMTIDRDESVVAWAQHSTDGTYEAIESIPGTAADGCLCDDLWMITKRSVEGSDVRYVERFREGWPSLHSGLEVSGSAQTAWTGLNHLAGEEVVLIADGLLKANVTVDADGRLTTPEAVDAIQVGLPLTQLPKVVMWTPEATDQQGTALGHRIHIKEVILGLLESGGLLVDNQPLSLQQFGDALLDQASPSVTGDVVAPDNGWSRTQETEIEAVSPFPIQILTVKRLVTVAKS